MHTHMQKHTYTCIPTWLDKSDFKKPVACRLKASAKHHNRFPVWYNNPVVYIAKCYVILGTQTCMPKVPKLHA